MGHFRARFRMGSITILAAATIASALSSCPRIPRTAGQDIGTGILAAKDVTAGTQSEAMKSATAEPPETIEMQTGRGRPAPESSVTTKPTVPKPAPRIAESLAGHDRHLVHRPFDTVVPDDFELGPLAAGGMDPSIASSLEKLEEALLARSLPDSLSGSQGARVASVILAEDLKAMPAPDSVRFATPLAQAGGTIAVALRIIVLGGPAQSQKMEASAMGMLILAPGDTGTMRIEHLEIDLASLGKSAVRSAVWDPYSLRISP